MPDLPPTSTDPRGSFWQRRANLLVLLAGFVVFAFVAALIVPESEGRGPVPPGEAAEAITFDAEAAGEAFMPGTVNFAVRFKNEVSPYEVMALFAMPGETVPVEAVLADVGGQFEAEAEGGTVERVGAAEWRWTAPETPGLYPVRVVNTESGETVTLNAFVKTPYDHSGTLNGYRIGQYQAEPLEGDPGYTRPDGFVELTEELLDVRVSPHFTLGQFQCKQGGDTYPKYLVLRERLLLKLERVLQEVNEAGYPASTFHVMSAYRTPYYNESIGNRTSYSRHLYGDAADIFVDHDEDVYMDDLDGDGSVTVEEARLLAGLVEAQTDAAWYAPFIGGLGIYSPAPHRGPFIHVDTRGTPTRW